MPEVKLSYRKALKHGSVGLVAYQWTSIQESYDLPWETINKIIVGWIAGDYDLIYNTNELPREVIIE